MESDIIWGIVVVLIVAIFIPYFIKFQRQRKADAARMEEAIKLGADKPMAQFPLIDEMNCIGCGSCVAACPEGDVLGIVFGRAAVINGLKCVGHGRCAEACPVGAIQVGLGDIKKRDDIPIMDEFNETNVPGVFIAGELGGMALIRNAISQGEMVIDRIAANPIRSAEDGVYDVVIVGAGPAGMSAGLSAIKNKLSYVMIDQQGFGGTVLQYPRKKLVMTRPIEIPLYGWLDKPEYSKEELLDIWHGINNQFHLNVKIGERLERVVNETNGFRVETQNRHFRTRYMVLALGRRGTPRRLNVAGEDQAKVMYKLLDAESYRNNRVLVIGGGDSAVEAAIGLARQPGCTVTISYRKEKFFRLKKKNQQSVEELIADGSISPLYNSTVQEITAESAKLKVSAEFMEIPNDYVFIFIGGEPPLQLLKNIGIAFGGEMRQTA